MLLGINYLLPTLYSAPPFRFKEKGILGIISDAAGAHAIPTLFIATTFSHLVTAPALQVTLLGISATAWSFFAGVRGILLHQLWDRNDDLRSGVKTLVTAFDVDRVRFWMSRVVFPIEFLLLIFLILIIAPFTSIPLCFFLLYILVKAINTKVNLSFAKAFETAPLEQVYVFPHDLYDVWMPLCLATSLAVEKVLFLTLFLLHIVLFHKIVKQRFNELNLFLQSWLNLSREFVRSTLLNLSSKDRKSQTQSEFDQAQVQLQQTQQEIEQLQKQLDVSQTESLQLKSRLRITEQELIQSEIYLQQSQTKSDQLETQLQKAQQELVQSQFERQIVQAEATRLKSYLHQTQGTLGVIDYYRHQIATNPDDIQLYYQALETSPDDAQFHRQLGNALVRQGQLSEAIATYQTALQFHPDNFEIHFELAKTLEKSNQWEEAIAAYQKAIALNPKHSLAHQYLGNALADRGQLHEASLSYHHALQLQATPFTSLLHS